MRFSIILTAIIVALAIGLGLLQEGRISTLQEDHRTLIKRARALGLTDEGLAPAAQEEGGEVTGGTAVASASRAKATGKEFAAELISFAKEMKEWEKKGEDPPPEVMRDAMALFQRFLELDADVIAHVIEEIRNTTEFGEDEKQEVIMISFVAMAQSAPRAALELFANSEDLVPDKQRARHMVQMALGAWAAEDPEGALAWLDLNEAGLPEGVAGEARKKAVAAAFRTDPELAIKMALRLDRESIGAIGGQLAMFVQSPEDQLKVLEALQGQLGKLPADPPPGEGSEASKEDLLRGGIVGGLAASLGRQSLAEAKEFLDQAALEPSEMNHLAQRMANQAWGLKNPGEWLPWISEHSAGDAREENVKRVMRHWTSHDFRAAANWIGQQPDGPLRENATWEFAHTVAPHEPDSAAAWAVTLPASEERTSLLKHIHTNWVKTDEAAAAEFAARHALEDQ